MLCVLHKYYKLSTCCLHSARKKNCLTLAHTYTHEHRYIYVYTHIHVNQFISPTLFRIHSVSSQIGSVSHARKRWFCTHTHHPYVPFSNACIRFSNLCLWFYSQSMSVFQLFWPDCWLPSTMPISDRLTDQFEIRTKALVNALFSFLRENSQNHLHQLYNTQKKNRFTSHCFFSLTSLFTVLLLASLVHHQYK